MKRMTLTVLMVLAALAASRRGGLAFAPESPIRPESRVWFSGASNIRRFTCKARQVAGSIDLRGTATAGTFLSGTNASHGPSLSVTVAKLDCGIGVMSGHLHEALLAPRYPTIEFRLATYEIDLHTAVPVARITGWVKIAGVERAVTTPATVRMDTLGRLHVIGTYAIRPTEFGVKPPRRFAGLLRVRDRTTVHFDVALDADNAAIDDIACALHSTRALIGSPATYAPHS